MTAESTGCRAFLNALRILYSMEPNWAPERFVLDPARYLMCADDEQTELIWAAIQARQPERYRGVKACS